MATDWFKMGVGFYRDPALIRAGEAAEVFFVRAIGYCAETDSKGRFPKAALALICPKKPLPRVRALCAEKLLIERTNEYEIRSWEKWQEQLDAMQERRRKDAERKRAERKAARESAAASEDTSADSPNEASVGQSKGHPQNLSISKDIKDGDGDGEKSSKTSVRAKPKTAAPDIFPPTDAMRTWIAEHGISGDLAKTETERFLEYHRSKGNRFADWHAAWRNWMLKVPTDLTQPVSRAAQLDREMGLT